MSIQVIRSTFSGVGRDGDFSWMIGQPEYATALFIFNDNEEQFLEHQRMAGERHFCDAGGGNAAIRAYQCIEPQRATGIPTGRHGGYTELSPQAAAVIDNALAVLDQLLASGRYDTVIYSWDDHAGTLGTGIFRVAREVLDYIVAGIDKVAGRY